MIYLELYRGRPADGLKDSPTGIKWGCIGPTFEAEFFASTYGFPRIENHDLEYIEDCIYYDGVLYADFSISSEPEPDAYLQPFDPAKAIVPHQLRKEANNV